MASRKTPYGYTITDGVLNTVSYEAEIVLKIFSSKLNGASGMQIASELFGETVPYFAESEKKAADRVYSILADERYTGKDGYPQIIDEDTFGQARMSLKKSDRSPKTDTYSALKKLTFCSECGRNMVHFSCRTGLKQWRCTAKGCVNFKPSLTDSEFISEVTDILVRITAEPDMLDTGNPLTEYVPTAKVLKLENEITRLKSMQPIDFDAVRREILALAATKYECCSYSRVPYITAELKDLVSQHQSTEEFDTEYLKRIVKRITVDRKKNISVEFINGRIISNKRKGEQNA
ncbi:hypothetical protein SAMN02910317_01987 [Ruminococcaceae bacterium FB2012]|nr:hypothetical protein SAMN02910317_01987 [Ruminococcaceae bacterium FB2012]